MRETVGRFVPIIRSRLDFDYYKLTMGQLVFNRYQDIEVMFGLNNRTKTVKLAKFVPSRELRRQLNHVRQMRFRKSELEYLASIKRSDGTQMFRDNYLAYLREQKLCGYTLKVEDGQFVLTFTGSWPNVIFWETYALSIINELYYRYTVKDVEAAKVEGRKRLSEKIEKLLLYSMIMIIEFGTRRRFSGEWQEEVLRELIRRVPNQLVGTSNVYLAMKYGIKPIGTMAHELFMVIEALCRAEGTNILDSQIRVLREWWDEYGEDLSIALTDTFGTDAFYKVFGEFAKAWRGVRQDSADVFEFSRKTIAFYESVGVDPRTKTLVPSDGLEIDSIIEIWERLHESYALIAFGWGTSLTNDLGFGTLSIVAKAIRANGIGTVKLSDNLAKATGSPEDIEHHKQELKYANEYYMSTTY